MKNTGWKLPLWAAYVVVTGMVGCASAGGQAGVGLDTSLNDSAERAAAVPPVYALLGERETIGLTSAQIAALDSLAIWLATTNRPLLEELSERGVRRNDGPTQEPGVARLGPPLLEEIGANNEAAEAAIQGLLTEDQQGRVCTSFAQSRRERSTSDARSTARRGVAPGFGAPDVANYVWPWCDTGGSGGELVTEMSSAA